LTALWEPCLGADMGKNREFSIIKYSLQSVIYIHSRNNLFLPCSIHITFKGMFVSNIQQNLLFFTSRFLFEIALVVSL